MVEEAKSAFTLNAGLFTILDLPEDAPEQDVALSEKAFPISQVIGVIAAGTSRPTYQICHAVYSLWMLIIFISAVCLAHFVLVIGGFTGDKGYEKLLAAEQWFATVFSQSK